MKNALNKALLTGNFMIGHVSVCMLFVCPIFVDYVYHKWIIQIRLITEDLSLNLKKSLGRSSQGMGELSRSLASSAHSLRPPSCT